MVGSHGSAEEVRGSFSALLLAASSNGASLGMTHSQRPMEIRETIESAQGYP